MFARSWPWVRIVFALLILAAVIAQLQVTVSGAVSAGRDVATTLINFFSFFTVQSNLLAAAVLLMATATWWRRGRQPAWLTIALACATTYMLVTGVVYNALLRSVALPQGTTVPWSNEVLHLVGPAFLLLDLFVAQRHRLKWWVIAVIAVYPLAWVAYTLTRGPVTTNPVTGASRWYPYPFLDPQNPDLQPPGYGGVLMYIAVIAVTVVIVGVFVVGWLRRHERRASLTEEAPQPKRATFEAPTAEPLALTSRNPSGFRGGGRHERPEER